MFNGAKIQKLEGGMHPQDVRKTGQIEIEINELNCSLERLESVAQQFESILLRMSIQADESPEQLMCSVANRIKTARNKVNEIANYLSNHQL